MMSNRETKIMAFDINSKVFNNYEETLHKANAIKRHIEYQCSKKGYSSIVYIGVSVDDSHNGNVTTGFRGKRLFNYVDNIQKSDTPPHIHMIVLSNPGETLTKELKKYFYKYQYKCENEVVWCKSCADYIEKRVDYVVNQSIKFRTVTVGDVKILEPLATEFCRAIEKCNLKMGNPKLVFPQLEEYLKGSA